MAKVKLVSAAISVALLAAAAAVYAGAYNVAADEPHWRLTTWLLQTVRQRSIEKRAQHLEVPDLDDPRLVSRAAREYAEMCASCHLAPGATGSAIRQGLNPQPPDLSQHHMDPRSAFWVIKHGIKATGMPAWGLSHDDAQLWGLVAFLAKLPTLDVAEYQVMLDSAQTEKQPHSAGTDLSESHDSASSREPMAEHGAGVKK